MFKRLTRLKSSCNKHHSLQFTTDIYNSRHIDNASLPSSKEQFYQLLTNSLSIYKEEKVGAVFLKLSLQHNSDYFQTAHKLGFVFHHAEDDIATLVKWVPEDRESMVPPFCSHYVGTGGMVINPKDNTILLVKDKIRPKNTGWKLPGGFVDHNEDINKAVEREVFEETGIKSDFQGILGFRENTRARFNKADFYFICLLFPKDDNLVIDKCDLEIEECEWMKVQDMQELKGVSKMVEKNAQLAKWVLEQLESGKSVQDIVWQAESIPYDKKNYPFYHKFI